jgi:ferredoxin
MITAKMKPVGEICQMVEPFGCVLLVGCGTCVAECAAGGQKEVAILAYLLRIWARERGRTLETRELTLDRQCVYEFLDQLADHMDGCEAIVSLGCGAGVQAIAELFPEVAVIPALDTLFIGETTEPGRWRETCRGCARCRLYEFGGVCPITRCAKHLLNGPCGGSVDGRCEVDPKLECAWQEIIRRLEAQGRLDLLDDIPSPVNWSLMTGRGPRKIVREDQRP